MSSQPLNVCHHTHPFNDITPFFCRSSPPLYMYYHIHFIKHHVHIFWHHATFLWHHMYCIHDLTSIISEMASTVSVSSQRLYWWSQKNCMYDIIPTLRMPSYALYKMSHPLFMTSHHCSYHIISTAFMTSHTLYMTSHTWQYKRYICHLTKYI